MLGRIHTAENVIRDVAIARELGFNNINLDLIFSVPGESPDDALSDARKIVDLRPEHISCYSLQLEEDTPFYEMAEQGRLTEVSDEEDRATYHRICDYLRQAGYEHYEISNFARSDADGQYRSQHNSLYWNLDDYIGLGLGASGFVNGVRYRNTVDIEEYFRMLSEDGLPVAEETVNSDFDNISEAVFTGLRRREGITYEEAKAAYLLNTQFSEDAYDETESSRHESGDADLPAENLFWKVFGEARAEAMEFAKQGLLIIDDKGLRLTESGIDISNGIMSLFV